MIKKFFLAVLFFVTSNIADAKMGFVGVEFGGGPLANSNATYFPGVGLFGTAGLRLGYVFTHRIGIISGLNYSYYDFDISYNRSVVAEESLHYLDVPLAARIMFSSKNNEKIVTPYIQAGIITGFLLKAYYNPQPSSYQSHVTYHQENSYELNKIAMKPMIQLGFLRRLRTVADFDFSIGVSSSVINVAKKVQTYPPYSEREIQGYSAQMGLTTFIVKIGFQFHQTIKKH